jgi:AraC family transcriptional activator of pobA
MAHRRNHLDKTAMIRTIPRYALYGEAALGSLPERMHCESIEERSQVNGWEILPHVHANLCQALWLRKGQCTATLGGVQHVLKGPVVLWVPEMLAHGFVFSPQADGTVFTLLSPVLTEFTDGLPTLGAALRSPQQLSAPASGGLAAALHALEAEYLGAAPGRLDGVRWLLGHALLQLARAAAPADGQAAPTTARSAQHVQAFQRLVEAHFRERRELNFYADSLGLSMTQLHRVCRQALGQAPLAVIHQRLQLEAERELVYTQLSIKEIAWLLGFQDPAYFTRFFTQRTGVSPQRYRAAAGP